MAIENAKTLNVRIRNKYDSYENWAQSNLTLEAGEIAIAYTTVDVKVDNGTAKHPALLMKVGDGTNTFANLPWLSARAADVLSVCKNEADLKEFVNGVIADAGIASSDAMEALAKRVTTTEGAIEVLNSAADVEGSVAKSIADAIAALNLADTYAAKEHKHEIADVNGLADAIADAKKAGTDANDALEAYKTANDAEVAKKVDKVEGKSLIADTEIARLANMSDGANKVEASEVNGNIKIDGVETVVYTHPTKHNIADIEGLQDALDGKQGSGNFAADDHTHTKEDITDFEHTHVAADITDLDDTIKSYDYATKTDAQGYVDAYKTTNDEALANEVKAREDADADLQAAIDAINNADTGILKQAKDYADGKDAAIEAAKKAGDDAMAEAKAKVASVTAGDASVTVAGISTAPTVAVKLDPAADNALKLNENGLKVEIGAAPEYSIVKAAESGDYAAVYNLTKDGAIVGASINIPKDMVVKSGSVVNDEIVLVLNDEAATEIKIPVASLIEYVTSGSQTGDMVVVNVSDDHKVTATITDGTITLAKLTTEVQTAIGKAHSHENATVLDGINADKVAAWDAAEANAIAKANELNGAMDTRMQAVEDKVATLEGEMDTAQADIDALEVKVDTGDQKVSEYVAAAIAALKIGDYAKAADLTAAIEQHNTDKTALEAEIAKKANDADLAAIAKTGSTDDLIQGEMTLVFDCGGAN